MGWKTQRKREGLKERERVRERKRDVLFMVFRVSACTCSAIRQPYIYIPC